MTHQLRNKETKVKVGLHNVNVGLCMNVCLSALFVAFLFSRLRFIEENLQVPMTIIFALTTYI